MKTLLEEKTVRTDLGESKSCPIIIYRNVLLYISKFGCCALQTLVESAFSHCLHVFAKFWCKKMKNKVKMNLILPYSQTLVNIKTKLLYKHQLCSKCLWIKPKNTLFALFNNFCIKIFKKHVKNVKKQGLECATLRPQPLVNIHNRVFGEKESYLNSWLRQIDFECHFLSHEDVWISSLWEKRF